DVAYAHGRLADVLRANGKLPEAEEARRQHLHTLGVAHYRAGSWQAALDALTKAEGSAPGQHLGFNGFFLAMAHWQLGSKDEAHKWYDRAARWSEKHKPQDEALRRVRAEAEQLLK